MGIGEVHETKPGRRSLSHLSQTVHIPQAASTLLLSQQN
jgi:hypothetical protein